MKKVIDDTFSTCGIVFFILIMWSLTSNSLFMFERNSLLLLLFSFLLILVGNYMRYKKKKTK